MSDPTPKLHTGGLVTSNEPVQFERCTRIARLPGADLLAADLDRLNNGDLNRSTRVIVISRESMDAIDARVSNPNASASLRSPTEPR
jgi:hypothetical protein